MFIMEDKFKDISYLKYGNIKQKRSYYILEENKILQILSEYNPLLVGTIPINIDVDNSDLDIICEVKDFYMFREALNSYFGEYKDFNLDYNEKESVIVCNFKIEELEIEIYGSKVKSEESNGYRHMIIEYRILNLLGEEFKDKIINLKENGLKTEPAFAKLLNLNGNPYEELFLLDKYSDKHIIEYYKNIKNTN